jgi:hypothetical protein
LKRGFGSFGRGRIVVQEKVSNIHTILPKTAQILSKFLLRELPASTIGGNKRFYRVTLKGTRGETLAGN